MGSRESLEMLYQCAVEYRFDAFAELFAELAPALPAEAYLMRAQIKLFVADATLLDDLDQAGQGVSLQFPCLNNHWIADSANRFVVFNPAPHALQRFLRQLPRAERELTHWYGETGGSMVRQMQSGILYFLGEFSEAIRLAEQQDTKPENKTDAILAQCVRFRCYLALGCKDRAEEAMLEMIRISKKHPECQRSYQAIRGWANLTTGWSGDTPRFCDDHSGNMLPVFEDRLEAIRQGVSRMSPMERPFVEYAARGCEEVYTMRQYYMDIFHALYWFQAGDCERMESNFLRAYRIALASGLTTPFVEYGEQIAPLFQHILHSGIACSHDWLAAILSLAEQYEENLDAYRA